MDLRKRWSMPVRNGRVPILVFKGTLATDDRDKVIKIIWEFMVLLGYRIHGGLSGGFLRPTVAPVAQR